MLSRTWINKDSRGHAGIGKRQEKRAENFYILYKGSSRSIGMSDPYLRIDAEPIHEPLELSGRELYGFGRVAGP